LNPATAHIHHLMRIFYLLIILGLILFMSYEFNWVTQHYDYLEKLADLSIAKVQYLESHCACNQKRK